MPHGSLLRQMHNQAKTVFNFSSNLSSLVIAKHVSNLILETHYSTADSDTEQYQNEESNLVT